MDARKSGAASVESLDRGLVRGVDAAMRAGERRAHGFVQCRLGSTTCCVGVVDVTALDAARRQRALRRLRQRRADLAAATVRRARRQWRLLALHVPGDRELGRLGDDERARRRLLARFDDSPCPVLEPRTGACLLYRSRPLSCRTFGLPMRCGAVVLPACELNFRSASAKTVAACTIEPAPADVEGALLRRLARESGRRGDTVVAAALALGG